MNEDARTDLIGFALAVAVVSLQQSNDLRGQLDDDLEEMLKIIEGEYEPEAAATLFWSASSVITDSFSFNPTSRKYTKQSAAYWLRVEYEFNAQTFDIFSGATPPQPESNVIDFAAHLKARQLLSA